jgi:hypothetical protein
MSACGCHEQANTIAERSVLLELMTMFVVPVLFCFVAELALARGKSLTDAE